MAKLFSRFALFLVLVSCTAVILLNGCTESNGTLPTGALIGTGFEISTITSGTGTGTSTLATSATAITTSTTGAGVDLIGSVYDSAIVSGVATYLANVKIVMDDGKYSTTSFSDGKYRLQGVSAGFHKLSFEIDDYEVFSTSFSLNQSFSLDTPLDFGLKRKVYLLKGKVLSKNEDKTPLANISIRIPELNASTTTSTTGDFIFTNVKSGLYSLYAASEKGNFDESRTQVEISKNGVISPDPISIYLAPNNFSIQGFAKLNTSREGLPNISVDIFISSTTNQLHRQTITTSEGKFIFENLSAGLYDLVLASGSQDFEISRSKLQILTDGTISPEKPEILLARTIKKEIYNISGTIKDAFSNAPLEYVTCVLKGYGNVLSDNKGSYSFKELPPGDYQIDFSKLGFNSTTVSFSLRAGGVTIPTSLDFLMVYNQESTQGSIVGRFVDITTKKGVPNLLIKVYQTDRNTLIRPSYAFSDASPQPIKMTHTSVDDPATAEDESGTFKVTHLKPTLDSSQKYLLGSTDGGTTSDSQPPAKYFIYVGINDDVRVRLATTTLQIYVRDPSAPKGLYTITSDSTNPLVPLQNGYIHSWEQVDVMPQKSTYLTNYDKENY
jgi:hypothetical protein